MNGTARILTVLYAQQQQSSTVFSIQYVNFELVYEFGSCCYVSNVH